MAISQTGPARHRIVLIGAGAVGTAVARLLAESGHEIVGVGPPDRQSTRRAADVLGAPIVSYDSMSPADLVLLGAPDAAIPSIVGRIGANLEPGAIVSHFAGSTGIAPLAALPAGMGRAALHPVQACPDVDTAIARLPGSAWGVTCPPSLRSWAFSLIENSLRGHPVAVSEGARPVWHAAAVTTANGTSAMLATGEAMLDAIGIVDPHLVLGPLAAGAVANARVGGGGAATLTGPVVRGEIDVIRAHLDNLSEGLDTSYRLVARTIIDAARRAGRIDEVTAAGMEELLDRP